MSQINFTRKTFFEKEELVRMQQFLSDDVAYNAVVGNTVQYGIIQTEFFGNDINFQVSQGTNTGTVQIVKDISQAVDANGDLIRLLARDNIDVTDDSSWYWMRISHDYRRYEEGTVSISVTGELLGVDTLFTEVLRGQDTDVPTKVRFVNEDGSTANNSDIYEVVSVTDDLNALITGASTIVVDTSVRMIVVGALPIGEIVSTVQNEGVYQYDSCAIDFIAETTTNTPPDLPIGGEGLYFYIARVMRSGSTVTIQDVRDLDDTYWKFNVQGVTDTVLVRKIAAPTAADEHMFIGTIAQGVTNCVKLLWRGASGRPYYIELEIFNDWNGLTDSPYLYAYFRHGAGNDNTVTKPEFYVVQNDTNDTFEIYAQSPATSYTYLSGYISMIGENVEGDGSGFSFQTTLTWEATGGTPVLVNAYKTRYDVWARNDIVDHFEDRIGEVPVLDDLIADTGWMQCQINVGIFFNDSIFYARKIGKKVDIFGYFHLKTTNLTGEYVVATLPKEISPPDQSIDNKGIPFVASGEGTVQLHVGMWVTRGGSIVVNVYYLGAGWYTCNVGYVVD